MSLSDEQRNGHPYPGMEEEDAFFDNEYEMTDELDHEILMHRDAHFGGSFEVMLEYYEHENVGVNPDFAIDRIMYLAQVEKELGKNLAPLLLTGPEAERVAMGRRAYQKFKDVYTLRTDNPNLKLIADLILTEEEEPEETIEKVASRGKTIVPDLIQIIRSDDAYDPLFPGYGYAPYLAALCLGRIADPAAIVPLFEMFGREKCFDEGVILAALVEIGPSAKEFLLKIVPSRPITQDNVNAALALAAFEDESIAELAFQQLSDPEVKKHPTFPFYLLALCDSLRVSQHRDAFIAMASDTSFPLEVRKEIDLMIREWKK